MAEASPVMSSTSSVKSGLRRVIFVFVWLVIWQLAAVKIDNSIIIAGPIDTFRALKELIKTPAFRESLLASSSRIAWGFFIGGASAFVLALISFRYKLIREFLSPAVTTLKAVPVVSFIIMVLLWSGPDVATVISALVVFPIIYLNTLQGMISTDCKLLEMARIFKISGKDRIRYIYLPHLRPFLLSAISLAAGMAWKSGIAAELIDQTQTSLGNGMYRSKISLATADMLAWTVAAVVLSFIFEKLLIALLTLLLNVGTGSKASGRAKP